MIALSPAHYGTDRPRSDLNATVLFDFLERLRSARTMVAFFANDPYDTGGRGVRAEEILTRLGLPHLVMDRPAGFGGHGAGESVGDMPAPSNSKGAFSARSGRVAGNDLVFEGTGQATLCFSMRPDGRFDGLWIASIGKSQLSAVLSHLQD